MESQTASQTTSNRSVEPKTSHFQSTMSQVQSKTSHPKKQIIFNQFGKRVIVNWGAYANTLLEREREKNKKHIVVSAITEKDNQAFKVAFKNVVRERKRGDLQRKKSLKKLESARSIRSAKSDKSIKSVKFDDEYVPCFIDYKNLDNNDTDKKSKKSKSSDGNGKPLNRMKVKVSTPPPMKTKPWFPPGPPKRKPKPVVSSPPPMKTRPWNPCLVQIKPKFKPQIEYPPLTLRQRPWKPRSMKVKSKFPKRVRLEKTFYPSPASTLGKTWHLFKFISSKFQILRGNLSQYSKRFNFRSNGKQSAFIAVVALVNSQLCPMKFWAPEDLDEIVTYGDINYRRHMIKLHKHATIKPPQIKFKVYLSRAVTYTEIGTKRVKGFFDPSDTKELVNHIDAMLQEFNSLIFTYCEQSYGIWKVDNAFYILNSEDTDEFGRLVQKTHGACCAIRSPAGVAQIVEYLAGCLRIPKKCYDIYSFKVNSVSTVEDNLERIHEELRSTDSKLTKSVDSKYSKPAESKVTLQKSKESKKNPPSRPTTAADEPTGLKAIVFEKNIEPEFGPDYKRSAIPCHGYLKGEDFLTKSVEDTKRSPFVCSASIAMLRVCKAALWKESTLKEAFRIGQEMYTTEVDDVIKEWKAKQAELKKLNEEVLTEEQIEAAKPPEIKPPIPPPKADKKKGGKKEPEPEPEESPAERRKKIKEEMKLEKLKNSESGDKHPDIPFTETRPVVKLKDEEFEIRAENVIFGKVTKRGQDVISMEDGLKMFFSTCDSGVIYGPDVVAVWRESNYFFMFDPTQCNGYLRSNTEVSNGCLSWFRDLDALVSLYIKNIPREFRNSIFKIAKVEVFQHEKISDDWQRFKAVGLNKWILKGKTSESSENFKDANRDHQATCISVVALAKTRELGVQSWTPEVIDEIIQIGDEFYSGSIMMLQEQEKLVDPNLRLSEIGNELKLVNNLIDLAYEEDIISGSLKPSGGLSLESGLRQFFKDDDLGVVTACGVSLGVFRHNDAFYLFDSHDRDKSGRNLKVNDPIDGCMVPGSACVLRFLSIDDLAKHIISNLEMNDTPVYNIGRVDATARFDGAPCLFNYKKFGEEPYGAFLSSFGGAHEDREPFTTNSPEKTLCNLLACLNFTKILNPRYWSNSDINEVLKIGQKMLCTLATIAKTEEETEVWQRLDKLEVCCVDLTMALVKDHGGTFSGRNALLPTAENSMESIEENVNISDIEVRSSRRSVLFSEGGASYVSSTVEVEKEISASLEGVLAEIDSEKEFFSTLHSKLFDIAIFKLDRFYYIFDPRESDENGMMVAKRLEDFMKRVLTSERSLLHAKADEKKAKRPSLEQEFEELIFGRKVVFIPAIAKPSVQKIAPTVDSDLTVMVSESGCGYIAWFTTIELLKNHILSKVPSKFENERFSFRQFLINKVPASLSDLAPWNSFLAVTPNHWILRSSLSQNDSQFANINRNHQDIPNCIIALTFAQLCTETDWNPTVLDVILKLGDRLYKKSLNKWLKSMDIPSNLRLQMDQIDLPVFIRPFVVSVNDEVVMTDPLVQASDTEPMGGMKKSLLEFLSAPDATGFLSSKDYHVAIWRSSDAYMMFDPHEVGPTGVKRSNGLACLQRFTNQNNLVETFCRSIKDLEGICEFTLTRVSVIRNNFKETIEVGDHIRFEEDSFSNYSDYNLYTSTNNVRSIRANEVKTIEWSKENIAKGVSYAVATLCISRSLDPEYYTHDIIDKMILFGNDLIADCDDLCFSDFDLCSQRQCPDEINWNFELNNVHTNIQMDIFRRGIISKYPCPAPNLMHSIEEFFNFFAVGVLVTQSFVVAIWKDCSEFFIFYSHPIDEVGRISFSRSKSAQPGLVVFKSVHELYTSIIGNIEKASYCKSFELRICNISMTDLCEEAPLCQEPEPFVEEELIKPAIAAIDECDCLPEKSAEKTKVVDKNLKDLISELKKKKNSSPGFIKFNEGGIIWGRLSKESKRFNQASRKFHSSAICLASVAMSCIKELACWSGETIDNIVKSGNSLYIESSVAQNQTEVPMSMLIMSLNFGGCSEINMKIESLNTIECEKEKLHSALCELFVSYSKGYVHRRSECWALIKSGKAFYIFDPLGIEIREKKMLQKRAVLYKFDTFDAMVDQLMICVESLCEFEDEEMLCVGAISACAGDPCPPVEAPATNPKKKCEKKPKCSPKSEEPPLMMKEIEPQCKPPCEPTEGTFVQCMAFEELCN